MTALASLRWARQRERPTKSGVASERYTFASTATSLWRKSRDGAAIAREKTYSSIGDTPPSCSPSPGAVPQRRTRRSTAASWRDSIAIPITSVYARFAIADSIIRSTSSTRRPSIATSASTSPPRSAFTARS